MCKKLRTNIYYPVKSRVRFITGSEGNSVPRRESWERKFHRMSAGFLPKAELVEIVEEVNNMPLSDERKYDVARNIMFDRAYA